MKKLPLLLTCGIILSSVPAQAKCVDYSAVIKTVNCSGLQQMIKCGNTDAVKNVLNSLCSDKSASDVINSLCSNGSCTKADLANALCKGGCSNDVINAILSQIGGQSGGSNAEEPKEEATEAPAEATEKPAAEPTEAPVPTAKPTPVPTAKPTAKPAATPKTTVSSETAMEQEVLRIVNEERAKYGLGALSWADDLAAVARAHSKDMINRGFFSHTNPDGLSPFDRLRNAGISYRAAAENIAYGQRSAQAVMDAWMNSSGHRANILNGSLKEIGIGAVKNSSGTIYWTQVFVTR